MDTLTSAVSKPKKATRNGGPPPLPPIFDWQQHALDFLADRPAAAIFAGLGTGKTRIILEDATRKDAALVVICPKTTISVWKAQAALWAFEQPMYVLNYERTWRDPGKWEDLNRDLRAWMEKQGRTRPLIVVLDESHKIKDRQTKQSQACMELGASVAYRRILTGTPTVNGLWDLWAQMHFLLAHDHEGWQGWRKWRWFADEHLIFRDFGARYGGRRIIDVRHKNAFGGRRFPTPSGYRLMSCWTFPTPPTSSGRPTCGHQRGGPIGRWT